MHCAISVLARDSTPAVETMFLNKQSFKALDFSKEIYVSPKFLFFSKKVHLIKLTSFCELLMALFSKIQSRNVIFFAAQSSRFKFKLIALTKVTVRWSISIDAALSKLCITFCSSNLKR